MTLATDENPTPQTPPNPAAPRPLKSSRARAGGYLFLPRAVQSGAFILWLRRMHAWTGVYGAVFFFFLGLTGFYLDHRAEMKIEGGTTRETSALSVFVEPNTLTSEAALADWMKKEYSIAADPARRRARPGGPVTFDGQNADQPAIVEVSFRSPNTAISARHVVGSNVVDVTRNNASVLRAVIDMHKVVGVGSAFILVMDTIAGAMVFMSLSGILLWTRLHGPRLAAVGLGGAVVIAGAIALSSVWVSSTLP